jgi:hypothetical protein
MRDKLTISMMTRQFCYLLSNMICPQFAMERPQFTQEANAETVVVILPEHLLTKSMDDIAEQLLLPAAGKMVEELKEAHAVMVFDAPMLDGVECSVHRCNGISVRGAVMRGVEIDGIVVDAFRFTVFYREAKLQ